MKVILIADVYKHGVAGEVVEVADGFARNYLIPKGLAVKATPGALKQAEKLRKEAAARRARINNELAALAEQLDGLVLTFAAKAGPRGKLYGSVTTADIADAIKEKLGIEIDRRRIAQKPLRELGEHQVVIRLGAELSPQVTVVIHREGEEPVLAGEQPETTGEATGETEESETAPVAEEAGS